MSASKGHILCVSWDEHLAVTRTLLLSFHGYTVTSAQGRIEAEALCSTMADLMVLGHSVPQDEKRKIVECFRQYNSSPVLSLLRPGQTKLPEVEYGVEYMNPEALVHTVESIMKSA